MDTTREQALRERARRIQEELGRIEHARVEQETAKLVGKYFVYPKNCYSCPTKPSDYWPVYFKVTRVDDGSVYGLEFQTDSDGAIIIRQDRALHYKLSGFKPCSAARFKRAWATLQRRVAAL